MGTSKIAPTPTHKLFKDAATATRHVKCRKIMTIVYSPNNPDAFGAFTRPLNKSTFTH